MFRFHRFRRTRLYLRPVFAFLAAQRAFISSESRLRPADVMPRLWVVGFPDVPDCFARAPAHLAFAAAEILALPAADIVRLCLPDADCRSSDCVNSARRRFSSSSIC